MFISRLFFISKQTKAAVILSIFTGLKMPGVNIHN